VNAGWDCRDGVHLLALRLGMGWGVLMIVVVGLGSGGLEVDA